MGDWGLRVLASTCLAVGGVLGMAGTFAPTASLRGIAWGIDGVALVVAGAVLTILFFRSGHDLLAAGFLVFAMGQSLVLSTAAMDVAAGTPVFGAGIGLWAASLALVGIPGVFPFAIRGLGWVAAALFGATAVQIFTGVPLTPVTAPLPFQAYPFLVVTFAGWIATLLKAERTSDSTR